MEINNAKAPIEKNGIEKPPTLYRKEPIAGPGLKHNMKFSLSCIHVKKLM